MKSRHRCLLGGEGFVALLPETRREEALAVLNRIRENISQLAIPEVYNDLRVTMSTSVVEVYDSSETVKFYIALANEALYVAKKAGRNNVQIYNHAT
jgi:diguanylate cyclase (GGDEF)-like protein